MKRNSHQLLPALAVLLISAGAAHAQSDEGRFYARGELGGAKLTTQSGYWWGPGGPQKDPRITLSLDDPLAIMGSVGFGYGLGQGVRMDGSVTSTTGMDVDASFASASNGSTAEHVRDIKAPVSTIALMGNLFVEPLRLAGSDSAFQPFLTGGVGVAVVSMGDWTRRNPDASRTTRTWEGSTQTNFAWTVGGGVSVALGDVLGQEGYLDLTYRYSDFGQARGGSAPVNPPPGRNSPTEPFNFNTATHAITAGLRLPIGY